ncbi:hypothetical protein LPJ81_003223, partial [Coemansia sp. IMI 209127]
MNRSAILFIFFFFLALAVPTQGLVVDATYQVGLTSILAAGAANVAVVAAAYAAHMWSNNKAALFSEREPQPYRVALIKRTEDYFVRKGPITDLIVVPQPAAPAPASPSVEALVLAGIWIMLAVIANSTIRAIREPAAAPPAPALAAPTPAAPAQAAAHASAPAADQAAAPALAAAPAAPAAPALAAVHAPTPAATAAASPAPAATADNEGWTLVGRN